MGLDMYLYKNKKAMESDDAEKALNDGHWDEETHEYKYEHGFSEVGYWRKANAIHAWFVKNVQNGKDDCSVYRVKMMQLLELKNICQTVLADMSTAEDLLPTQGGFFFGDTAYDDWYKQDLEYTVKMIDKIKEEDDCDCYYYHSSW